jgi:ectoine hydroxylase-related dioxygenase (phytanoyl-CoA dioxygenase family)
MTLGASTPASEIAATLREDGCLILADLVDPEVMDQVMAEVESYLCSTAGGRIDFLGRATRRVGALIARSPTVRSLATHPTILDTLEFILCDNNGIGRAQASTFQIDQTQIVDIGPGEPAQMLHRDQWTFDHYPFPVGFEAEVGTMWAATDFTEEMGATRVIVGSNRWEDEPSELDSAVTTGAVMSKGSVLLYTGSVFHGGGANTSDVHRVGINLAYSRGWLRQEENQYLGCSPEIARSLPEGLLRLMGYQRGSFNLGYVDDVREPLDWLYDEPSSFGDFYAYCLSARQHLRRTGSYRAPAG